MNKPLEFSSASTLQAKSVSVSPWVRHVARVLASVMLLQATLLAVPVQAQVTPNAAAAAGQRAIMDAAQNGVPIAHIAPPSAAGVSRNEFTQFNVGTPGLILNNSASPVQTQLGGWVSGNMQLGPVPARIILNEVVGGDPSQLRGAIEVAGKRADIVIANPNGITCDGCGFLNTGRATLTTGQPQRGAGGAITGFNVQQGQIQVGGNGLNASALEQLDLIARGIVIEGEVWAQNLNVIAGANQVLYGTLQAATQSGTGPAPAFAIDIKELGGMYANQIYMVATEKGLGVNSTGRIAALQGNLVLDANGDLTLQHQYASKDARLTSAGDIKLNGETRSDGGTVVTAAGKLTQNGVIDSAIGLDIKATTLDNSGELIQRGADGTQLAISDEARNTGSIYSEGSLRLQAGRYDDQGGLISASGNLELAAGEIALSQSTINAGADLLLQADGAVGAVDVNGSTLAVGGNLQANAGGAITSAQSNWRADGKLVLNADAVTNLEGTMQANQGLEITAVKDIDNRAGKLLSAGDVSLTANRLNNAAGQIAGNSNIALGLSGDLDNSQGSLSAGNDLMLNARGNVKNESGDIIAGRKLTANSGALNNDGGLIAALSDAPDALVITSSALSNREGMIDSAGGLRATSEGTIDNAHGAIQAGTGNGAGGAATLTASALLNTGGSVLARGNVDIATGALDNRKQNDQQGIIASQQGNISIDAGALDNTGSLITSAATTRINAAAVDNTSGEISADDSLVLNTGTNTVVNAGGKLLANGQIDIHAGELKNTALVSDAGTTRASILGGADVTIVASQLDNTGSDVGAGGNLALTLASGKLNNTDGLLEAGQSLAATAQEINNQQGLLQAGKDVALQSDQLSNANGVIVAGQDVAINNTDTVTNGDGVILAERNLQLTTKSLSNTGTLASSKDLNVEADSIDNQGEILANANARVAANTLTNAGTIAAANTVIEAEDTFANAASGTVDGSQTTIRAKQIDNQGSLYGDLLRLGSQTLNNASTGTIAARDTLLVGAKDINNTDGALMYSAGDIGIGGSLDMEGQLEGNAATLVNASSRIEAVGNINLAVDDLVNRNDGLVTRVETTTEPINKTYIQPRGSVRKYDRSVLGWDPRYKDGSGRFVRPSTKYPFSVFGAVPMKLAVTTYCEVVGEGDYKCTDTRNYPNSHSAWKKFGVAPPDMSDVPVPVLPSGKYGFMSCMTSVGEGDSVRDNSPACKTYWNTYDNYYAVLHERQSKADAALNAKIKAFNSDVVGRSFEAWNEYRITSRTTSKTVVDATAPAQILAGGDIAISGNGSKRNEDSQIVSGGTLQISGTEVVNSATQGTQSITESGKVRFRRIEHHGGFCDCYEVELHPWYKTTGAPVVTTFQLPGFAYAANAANPSIARNLKLGDIPLPAVPAPSLVAPQIQQVMTKASGAQTDDVILSALPALTPPTNSLFKLNAQPVARYLVEADPRFTSYRSFLSSDYFLQTLNRDPERQLKRYGDGFVEQRLVTDQIVALTGRRFLSGYSDTETEYRSLMDAGVAFARAYQLTPGVALTAEQMALLTTDIVWLTEQTVTLADGRTQQVLVPQVYLRRPQSGDLQPSGALLAGSDIVIKSDTDLVNSGDILAERSNTLLAGRDLVNAGGRVRGQDVFARSGRDLKNLSGVIQGTGNDSSVALLAGRDIVLQTRTIESSTQASATTAATRRISLDRIATVQGGSVQMAAARDLVAQGSTVAADQNLIATAGGDINASSAQGSYSLKVATGGHTKGRTGYIQEETVANQVASFAAGNDVTLAAANTVSLQGTDLAAGNDLLVQGGDVTVTAAKDRRLDDVQRVGGSSYNRTLRDNETLAGGNLTAGRDLTVIATRQNATDTEAGGNVTLQGATLVADTGQIGIAADNDITVDAVTTRHVAIDESYLKLKGLTGSRSTEMHSTVRAKQANGSTLSGNTVVLQAGNAANQTGNLTVAGSTVVADGDITATASKNIALIPVENTSTSRYRYEKKQSGLFGSGASITLGKQQLNQNSDSASTTQTGATIGSVNGDITLQAGEQYSQTGSQVIAPQGDIVIAAKQVDIDAAYDASSLSQETRFKQSGLTVALSSPAISAGQTVAQMTEAAGKTKDRRMQALAAGAASFTLYNNAGDIGKSVQALANGSPSQAVGLSISIGSSKSSSSATQTSSTATGSTVAAGNDLAITATQGDLQVEGSALQAGRNLALTAAGNVNLVAAQNTAEQHSTNRSSSGSIGVTVGGPNKFGVTLAASKARGNADGKDVAWTNTQVDAGDTVAIVSGDDTALRGAVVTAPRITADVGGNLAIESLQDTTTFNSKQRSASASLTIGPNFVPTGGSIGGGKSAVNSNYASVTEQSGLKAGDQGFQVTVANNTDLKGGAITSTQAAIDNGKNSFTTGGALTTSDIQNVASYSGKGGAINIGAGTRPDGKLAPQGTSVGLGSDKGNASSTTTAAISGIAGDKAARTGDAETGIGRIFDAERVQQEIDAQVAITQTFTREAPKAVANYAQSQLQEAKRLDMQASTTTDPQEKAALQAQAAALRETWKEGGVGRVALHTVMGGLSGGLAGAAGAAVSASSAELMDTFQDNTVQALKDAGVNENIAKAAAGSITALTAAGMGAAVGSTAGAVTALTVDVNNRQLHPTEAKLIKDNAARYAERRGGISIAQAEAELTQQSLRNVDSAHDRRLGGDNAEAQAFLEELGAGQAAVDPLTGQRFELFAADAATRENRAMFGQYAKLSADTQSALDRAYERAFKPAGAQTIAGLNGTNAGALTGSDLALNDAATDLQHMRSQPQVVQWSVLGQLRQERANNLQTQQQLLAELQGMNQRGETGAQAAQRRGEILNQLERLNDENQTLRKASVEQLKAMGSAGTTNPARHREWAEGTGEGIAASRLNFAGMSAASLGARINMLKGAVQEVQAASAVAKAEAQAVAGATIGTKGGAAATADTQSVLTQQVGDLRATLTGNAKTGGNMGVAQIDIPGIQSTMAASSRVATPTAEQQALGFVGQVPEQFPSSVVPLPDGYPLLRSVDSEAKILNNVAAQLGENTSARGTINLLTERAPCTSCSNIIQQFQAKYPSIKINIMDNGGVIIPPTKKEP